MAHTHGVIDTDKRFHIDPITREITNEGEKFKVVQGDHNSERFTFDIPRLVDGHDMSSCSKTEIRFINIARDKSGQSTDVYLVDDLAVDEWDEDKVMFSWLVSGNATKYAGTLIFLIRFTCLNGEEVDYAWNTEIYSGISVSGGIENGEAVIAEYADILETWKSGIVADLKSRLAVIFEEKEVSSPFVSGLSFELDKTYDIYWNGTRYICTSYTSESEVYTGNGHIINSNLPDTGEPFLFTHLEGASACVLHKTASQPSTNTLKVTTNTNNSFGGGVQSVNGVFPDENGNVVLPVSGGGNARIGTVTLLANAWNGSNNLYSQIVTIDGVTANSQIDLTPSVEQLAIFYEKDLGFVTENENGVVTVYAIGQKPQNDYVIQVTITEVSV